jgi:membrane associated rhomboid family serine protease
MNILQNLFYLGRQAKVTSTLIIINIIWFTISRLFDSRSFNDTLEGIFLIDWGADVSLLTFSGQYWRMLTSIFMHTNISHLVMNMLALLSVGTVLEKHIPKFVFIGIYFLTGLISSLTSNIATIQNAVISCGASGAILGLITALLGYSLVNRTNLENMPIKAIIASLILTAGLGMLPSINNMAHLGGAISGFILGLLISFCIKVFHYPNRLTFVLISILYFITALGLYMGYMHFKLPDNFQLYY